MPITVTIERAITIANSLRALAEIKLPVKLAYRVGRLCDHFDTELKRYQRQRHTLVQEHARRATNGMPMTCPGESGPAYVMHDQQAFEAAHRELLDETVAVRGMELPLSMLEQLDGIEPIILAPLGDFLVDDTESSAVAALDGERRKEAFKALRAATRGAITELCDEATHLRESGTTPSGDWDSEDCPIRQRHDQLHAAAEALDSALDLFTPYVSPLTPDPAAAEKAAG